MTVPLVDPKTGQLYDAPDEPGAQAQMRAYGLERATDEQVSGFDHAAEIQARSGGLADQFRTGAETAAGTVAKTLGFIDRSLQLNPDAPTAQPEEIAPSAFTPEAKERREANPKAAFLGAAAPDVAFTALMPELGLVGRAATGGILAEGGASTVQDKPFSVADAGLYGLTGGVLEGAGGYVLGGAMRALGKTKDALDGAVGKARQWAAQDAASEVAPGLRAQKLVENAPEIYAQHQETLDTALSAIDERVAQAPERTFSPGALKKTVSDNQAAQADHFLDVAVKMHQAAEVSGDAGLQQASETLRDALEASGAKMFAAMREAHAALSDTLPQGSNLAQEAFQALEDSLRNEGVWGKAAKNQSTVMDAAKAAGPASPIDIASVNARQALDDRLAQARQMAAVTGDKKLAKAIRDAEGALGAAEEVTGARLMGDNAPTPPAAAQATGGGMFDGRVVDRLRQEAGVPPHVETPAKGAVNRLTRFGNDLAEYEIDNFVQSGLKAGGATIGHMVGGVPGAVVGYLAGRWAHIHYGDPISHFVWDTAKKLIRDEGAKDLGKTVATVAGGSLGGLAAGVPGAIAGGALGRNAAVAAGEAAQGAKELGERWASRIWKGAKQVAKDNAGPAVGTAALLGAGALASDKKEEGTGAAPAAASIGLLAFFLQHGRGHLTEQLGEALSQLTARERFAVRQATERAAEGNAALLKDFAANDGRTTFSHPTYGGDIAVGDVQHLRDIQLTRLRDAYLEATHQTLHPETFADPTPDHIAQALERDMDLRNTALVESDPQLLRLGTVGPSVSIRGEGRGTIGNPQLRRYGLPDPAESAIPITEGETAMPALLGQANPAAHSEQGAFPFARADSRTLDELANHQWERQNAAEQAQNALIGSETLNGRGRGDMPGIAASSLESLRNHLQVPAGATEAQAETAGRAAFEQWSNEYRRLVGEPPNPREAAFAEADLRARAGDIWTQRQVHAAQEIERRQPTQIQHWEDDGNDTTHPLLREVDDDEEEALAEQMRKAQQRLSLQGREEGSTGYPHDVIETMQRQSGQELAPHERMWVLDQMGEPVPRHTDEHMSRIISDLASEDYGELDHGYDDLDAHVIAGHLPGGLSEWEEHHILRDFDSNESYYQREYERQVDGYRQEREDEYRRENGLDDDEESPPSSEAPSSRQPGEREHYVVGLPKAEALHEVGLKRVLINSSQGFDNVFGAELSLKDVKDLFALDPLTKYASETGARLDTSLTINRNSINYEGAAGPFRISTKFQRNGVGELVLSQGGLFLPRDLQGQGIAKQMIKPAIEVVQRLGAREVSVPTAAEIGKYAWPALGFRPDARSEEYAFTAFNEFLSGIGAKTATNLETIRDVADYKVPVATIEDLLPRLRENYALATGQEGSRFDRAFVKDGEFKAGKAFLLAHGGSWNSDLSLTIDPGSDWYKQFIFRLGLLSTAGLTGAEVLHALQKDGLTFKMGDSEPKTELGPSPAELEQHAQLMQQYQQVQETQQKLAYLAAQRKNATLTAARALTSPPIEGRTVPRVAGLTQSLGVGVFLGANDNLQSAFQEKKAMLARLGQDPKVLIDEMSDGLSNLKDASPKLHDQVVAQVYRVAQFLNSKLPGTIGASLTRPDGTPPSDVALRQFALYYSAATNPASVLGDLANNRARKEQVETLRELWPETYMGVKTAVLDQFTQQRPSPQQRMRLDLLFDFGQALDTGLSNRLVASLGNYRMQKDQQKGGGAPGAGPKGKSTPSILGASPFAGLDSRNPALPA